MKDKMPAKVLVFVGRSMLQTVTFLKPCVSWLLCSEIVDNNRFTIDFLCEKGLFGRKNNASRGFNWMINKNIPPAVTPGGMFVLKGFFTTMSCTM